MVRLSTPEGMAKHGFTFQAIKEWRQKEYDEGRHSGFEDFLREHGICVECRGEGTLVLGARWRDAEGIEHAEKGPVGSLVINNNLDNPAKWLTDSMKWDYLY